MKNKIEMGNTGEILITNIQRFSLHDGPGIRTTVFLKGCSLRCPWCSNPENLVSQPQQYYKNGIKGVYGKYIKTDDLVIECLKDQVFYENKIGTLKSWYIKSADEIDQLPGGVTFSGGEPLLQINELVPVCNALHNQGVHIAVETCLFVPTDNIAIALNCIDLFYIDVKVLNMEKCLEWEHGDLNLYLTNLDMVLKSKDVKGVHKPIVLRIPVIGSYTDDIDNRFAVKKLLSKYKDYILKIELIKEHNLGEEKYKSLFMKSSYHGVEDDLMRIYMNELLNLNIPIELCKI